MFKVFLIFLSSFTFLSPAFAMDESRLVGADENPHILILRAPQKEKTAEEIISENKHMPEHMGCAQWFKQEFPEFPVEDHATHPLFPYLSEAMSLADFEADVIEKFIHEYLETEMPKEQAECMITLRQNSMRAKNLVRDLVHLLQGKMTIDKLATDYFESRLKAIVEYQATLLNRKDTHLSGIKAERMTNDPRYSLLNEGFLRSHNIKNKIMRDLLYSTKNQNSSPLIENLTPKLINLIRLSTSLHAFFDGKTNDWLDYDDALAKGEARGFLAHLKDLGIDKNKDAFFKSLSTKIPKSHPPLSSYSLPNFLLSVEKGDTPKKQNKKCKNKKPEESLALESNKQNLSNILPLKNENSLLETNISKEQTEPLRSQGKEEINVLTDSTPTNTGPTEEQRPFKIGFFQRKLEELVEFKRQIELEKKEAQIEGNKIQLKWLKQQDKLPKWQSEAAIRKIEERLEELLGPQHITSNTTAAPSECVLESSLPEIPQKIRNKHTDTVYDIFRPKGYTSLDSTKIINAWKHLLNGQGYHKESTGRSHQPLYATLSNGSKVVFGLFISKSYGPHYIKHVQTAFERIGFGRNWLESQGYTL